LSGHEDVDTGKECAVINRLPAEELHRTIQVTRAERLVVETARREPDADWRPEPIAVDAGARRPPPSFEAVAISEASSTHSAWRGGAAPARS
jgi:hypothetical protein